MPEKEIQLLKIQMDKLNNKDFDLDAWKKSTIIILARIFGENSLKIKQIESIEYDYSSWSLRDTTGFNIYLDSCKKLGREILQASIDELETLGLPKTEETTDEFFLVITGALQDELKGMQVREIKQILSSGENPDAKRVLILEKLKEYGSEISQDILSNILTSLPMIKKFTQ
ncbi:MAG: hypothetical protein M0Q51_13795 [Bacteroidales bacterium]|nr:hypothetical protein [Bacteroidales bacterium]